MAGEEVAINNGTRWLNYFGYGAEKYFLIQEYTALLTKSDPSGRGKRSLVGELDKELLKLEQVEYDLRRPNKGLLGAEVEVIALVDGEPSESTITGEATDYNFATGSLIVRLAGRAVTAKICEVGYEEPYGHAVLQVTPLAELRTAQPCHF